LKVLTFLHSFEPGGVERIALRLVRQWRALGTDAPLFIGRVQGDMRHDVGAGLDYVTPARSGPWVARWETLWMIWMLPRTIRTLRPDILFCAGNTYAVVAVAMKLRFGRRCPFVLAKISNDLDRLDASWCQRALYRFWLKLLGRFLDHFVGMEAPMAEEIRERLGARVGRITIIPDPALSRSLIDMLIAHPGRERSASTGRHFVAVGRLAPQKNIALMLRAFDRGAIGDDRLTVIGDGPERPKLEILARRLGLGDRVTFRGYVPDPAAILPDFDILLLSSNYEGVPAVLLEALAARLPIIATNCSRSMATLLQHGLLGELVPVGDERALAGAIRRANPAPQDRGLSLAQAERFTLEHAAEAYLAAMAGLHRREKDAQELAGRTEVPAGPRRQGAQVGDTAS